MKFNRVFSLICIIILGCDFTRAQNILGRDESKGETVTPDPEESSTVAITSARMYNLEVPKRRFMISQATTPKTENETFTTTEKIEEIKFTTTTPTPLNETCKNEPLKEDDIVIWLKSLSEDEKLKIIKKLGWNELNCIKPRRRCSEYRKKYKEPVINTTIEGRQLKTQTTSTTLKPENNEITTPKPESLSKLPTERRMIVATERPLNITKTTESLIETTTFGSTTIITTTSSTTTNGNITTTAKPKERSKCRRKKKY